MSYPTGCFVGISEKTYYYWLRKLRSQMAEAAAPQLEPSLTPIQDDVLQMRYRGVELKLPVGVDMDAVAALRRSLQALWAIWEMSAIITLPTATPTCAVGLMVLPPWSSGRWGWIPSATLCSCSAADGVTRSRPCTGMFGPGGNRVQLPSEQIL